MEEIEFYIAGSRIAFTDGLNFWNNGTRKIMLFWSANLHLVRLKIWK